MTGHRSTLKGYRLDAKGRLVPIKAALPANKRIASKSRKTYKPVTLTEMMAELTPEQRQRVEDRAAQLIDEVTKK